MFELPLKHDISNTAISWHKLTKRYLELRFLIIQNGGHIQDGGYIKEGWQISEYDSEHGFVGEKMA